MASRRPARADRARPGRAERSHPARADRAGREQEPVLPTPVDVVDGIPDRTKSPAWWKYALIFAIFLAWLIVLILIQHFGALR